ncbi:Protein Sel-1 3 [Manis pentadactyla]|nr:Protein Sel-1 3 [Manis pentadactyla]
MLRPGPTKPARCRARLLPGERVAARPALPRPSARRPVAAPPGAVPAVPPRRADPPASLTGRRCRPLRTLGPEPRAVVPAGAPLAAPHTDVGRSMQGSRKKCQ